MRPYGHFNANDEDHLAGMCLIMCGGALRAGDDLVDDFATHAAWIVFREDFATEF